MEWSGQNNFVASSEVPFEVDGSEAGILKSHGPLSFLKVCYPRNNKLRSKTVCSESFDINLKLEPFLNSIWSDDSFMPESCSTELMCMLHINRFMMLDTWFPWISQRQP